MQKVSTSGIIIPPSPYIPLTSIKHMQNLLGKFLLFFTTILSTTLGSGHGNITTVQDTFAGGGQVVSSTTASGTWGNTPDGVSSVNPNPLNKLLGDVMGNTVANNQVVNKKVIVEQLFLELAHMSY